MKKLIFSLFFSMIALFAMSQCQAWFTTSQDTMSLHMYDASYNTDSSMINVTSWDWTITGMGLNYSYTTQNPSELLSNLPSGNYLICLTIITSTSCTSTYCDSLYIGTTPNTCNAYFTYTDLGAGQFSFTDQSTATGTQFVDSWDWVLTGATPATSPLQNPTVTYASQGMYNVSLQITTDQGCTDTYTTSLYYYDSLPCITSVDVDIYHVTTVNGNDGAIDLTVYGGTGPYSFNWSNGATTEDIYGLSSGVYTAVVNSSDSMCASYTISANVMEPYDSLNPVIDTLNTPIIDSCLGFVPDSFYIGSVSTFGNIVSVEWIFVGAGQTATIWVDYTFSSYGSQLVIININCDSAKTVATYMSYIYIHNKVSIDEDQFDIGIYPVPTTNILNISLENNIQINTIRIFTSTGVLAFEVEQNETSVNVEGLPDGLYILYLETDAGPVQKQFVIMH